MSPRKTRRGVKGETGDVSLQSSDVNRISDTPDTTRRTLRTRRQLKQKASSDSDIEQSPQLNESKRSTRRGKGRKVVDTADDTSMNVTMTTTSARKRTRKDKEMSRVLAEETLIADDNNETQKPVSAAKPKVSRSRKKGTQKKCDITVNDLDNAENLPNDQNIINHDGVSKCSADEKNDDDIEISNEDDEVANVSKKAARKLSKTPRISRFLQPRSCNINSPNSTVTPECSPLTVNLTPHRATKTPRKSPINIGSPKTHSLSPQRLSKTPRKLPVCVDSPVSFDKSPVNATIKSPPTHPASNKSKTNSPIDNIPIRSSSRRVSKSPKIILRTPKSKSPRVTSTKLKKLSNPKKNSHFCVNSSGVPSPETMNSPMMKNAGKTAKSPLLVLDRISPSTVISSSGDDSVTPIIMPNSWRKQLVCVVESPRRQKSIVKRRSPMTDSETPLRAIPSPKLTDIKETLNKSETVSTNSTPLVSFAAKTKSALTSSTPRERIRPSLNLSPGIDASPAVSGAPLSVETFYGTSPKTLTHIHNNNKNMRIEDESNVLFTDDDSSLFEISGIKAVENSKNDITLVSNNNEDVTTPEKVDNTNNDDTYELAESVTPDLKHQNKTQNDTYELDEPKTPGLRKRRSLVDTNLSVAENSFGQISNKRVCRVRFASPSLNSPRKVVSKDPITSRLSTPAIKGLRKRTVGHVNNVNTSNLKSPKAEIRPRRRSNSLTNLRIETPTVSGIKKRSLSVIDMCNRSSQKRSQSESVNRLSRPRVSMSCDKKAEVKPISARKAPNFAQMHQKKFAKMESLVDAKKRVEERHNALINNGVPTPSTSKTMVNSALKMNATKVIPSDTTNGVFNRFGYRVRKEEATKLINKQPASKRINENKAEKRMALKGVRSNRRFELQMKMRNKNL